MIKRPAACQSDAQPAPKKPATMDEPASTSKHSRGLKGFSSRGLPLGRPGRAAIHKPKSHATQTCPLGPFAGVPTEATPYLAYKDFRIYTAMNTMRWRVVRKGERSEIPPDAHDNYLFCGTTAYIGTTESSWALRAVLSNENFCVGTRICIAWVKT